jgi:uncharacterized protein DUF6785/uncharacterized protein DUF6784
MTECAAMSETPETTDATTTPPEEGGFLSKFRCVVIGLILAAIIGLTGPYWFVYLRSSRLWMDYHTGGVVFFLLVLMVFFNVIVGRVWKRARLRGHELMFIAAMMFASGSIASSGLVAYFVPSIAKLHYEADSSNEWREKIVTHVNPHLLPFDKFGDPRHGLDADGVTVTKVAVNEFWEGIDDKAPIHWGPWIGPFMVWGIFFAGLFALLMAVMVVMRKQWVDYEHLSFPIAQVPAELCAAADDPGGPTSIFRSRAFWVGLGLVCVLMSVGGVAHYIDDTAQLYFRTRTKVPVKWRGVEHFFHLNLEIAIIALVFLVPNRVAFSVWSFALVGWLLNATLKTYGITLKGQNMPYGGSPIPQHLVMGGLMVFVLSNFYTSRRHLARVLKCALGTGERGYDDGEASRYRTALIVIIVGSIVVTAWLIWAGLRPVYAVAFLLLTFTIFYAMTRVVAQCGLPVASAPSTPSGWLGSVVGSKTLQQGQIATLALLLGWNGDVRNLTMSGAAHGLSLTKRRRGGLLWAMLAAVAVTYIVGVLFSVYMANRFGGASSALSNSWTYGNQPKVGLWWASGHATTPLAACKPGLMWGAVGVIVMGLLVLASRTLFWWPIHPVGLLLFATHMVQFFWLSIFIAWLTKAIVVYLGGNRAARTARKFFLGALVGCFLIAGIWACVDTLADLCNSPKAFNNALFTI